MNKRLLFIIVLFVLVPALGWGEVAVNWLHQSVTDYDKFIGQDVVGDNSVNLFMITDDTEYSDSEFNTYAEKAFLFALDKIPESKFINAISLKFRDDSLFYEDEFGIRFRGPIVFPGIEDVVKRPFNLSRDYIIYVSKLVVRSFAGSSIYTDTLDPLDVVHELGHLLADLRDEYFASSTSRQWQEDYLTARGGQVREINLWGDSRYVPIYGEPVIPIPKEELPWADFVSEGVPIPVNNFIIPGFGGEGYNYISLPEFDDKISAFGSEAVLFKPAGYCIMDSPPGQNFDFGFCPVCHNAMNIVILSKIKFASSNYDSGIVNIRDSLGINLEVINTEVRTTSQVVKPLPRDLRVDWSINGSPEPSWSSRLDLSNSELLNYVGDNLSVRVTYLPGAVISNHRNPYNGDYTVISTDKDKLSGDPAKHYVTTFNFDIVDEAPLPTSTPVPPTNTPRPTLTPVPPTATPLPIIIAREVTLSLGTNGLIGAWQSDSDPDSWQAHLYRGVDYLAQANPPLAGDKRQVTFAGSFAPGSYTLFVAATSGDKTGSFVASSSLVISPEPTPVPPTSTPVPVDGTVVLAWSDLPYFGPGIGQNLPEVPSSRRNISEDNTLLIEANDGEVATFLLPIGEWIDTGRGLVTFSLEARIINSDIAADISLALLETDNRGGYTGRMAISAEPSRLLTNNWETIKVCLLVKGFVLEPFNRGVVPLLQVASSSASFGSSLEFRNPKLQIEKK